MNFCARISLYLSPVILLCGFGYADQNVRYTYRCDRKALKVTLNLDHTIKIEKKTLKGNFTVGQGEAPSQPGYVDYQGKIVSLTTRRRQAAQLSVTTAFLNGKSPTTIRLDRNEYTDCKLE